ncbi:MAG: hypothetical protein IJU66_06345 [Oscillospiraceae bacterium]|nr:hypothetical protein [Oscillospiraceae bacterium]
MTLENAYAEVKSRLDSLDFSELWRGFHPLPFALYDEKACFFDGAYVEKTDEFTANTTIEYRGGHIAIWNMETAPEDFDVLASKIAHEIFHAFQEESGESRWANEMDALKNYRNSAENITGRLREAACMRAILRDGERSRFAELLALRKARAERFPYEYDYESRIEQLEGSAQYVELRALERLDEKKAARAWETLWESLADPARYVPARMISYSTGTALLACIRTCSEYDAEAFTPVPFAQGILAEAAEAAPLAAVDPRAAEAVAAYEAETRAIIDAALRKKRVVLRGKYPLASLNVATARRDGRYAISYFFVMYRDAGTLRTLRGDFVVELDGEDDISAVYEQ